MSTQVLSDFAQFIGHIEFFICAWVGVLHVITGGGFFEK